MKLQAIIFGLTAGLAYANNQLVNDEPIDTSIPPPTTGYVPVDTSSCEVLGLTNNYRATRGLGSLLGDSRLNAAAQDQCRKMARVSELKHDVVEGEGPGDRCKSAGYRWRSVAENIYRGNGYGAGPDSNKAVTAWIRSAGHERNMVGSYTHMGAASCKGNDGYTYWVQVFASGDDVQTFKFKSDSCGRKQVNYPATPAPVIVRPTPNKPYAGVPTVRPIPTPVPTETVLPTSEVAPTGTPTPLPEEDDCEEYEIPADEECEEDEEEVVPTPIPTETVLPTSEVAPTGTPTPLPEEDDCEEYEIPADEECEDDEEEVVATPIPTGTVLPTGEVIPTGQPEEDCDGFAPISAPVVAPVIKPIATPIAAPIATPLPTPLPIHSAPEIRDDEADKEYFPRLRSDSRRSSGARRL